jgi:hypothetical protein
MVFWAKDVIEAENVARCFSNGGKCFTNNSFRVYSPGDFESPGE